MDAQGKRRPNGENSANLVTLLAATNGDRQHLRQFFARFK
jgi:hypothetical protein